MMEKIYFYFPEGSWSHICEQDLMISLRNHGQEVGLQVTNSFDEATHVFISAGAPIWASVKFDGDFLKAIQESSKSVIIGEQHEYGWRAYGYGEGEFSLLTYSDKLLQTTAYKPEYKYQPLQEMLLRFIENGRRFIYFKREILKSVEYPNNFFPFSFTCHEDIGYPYSFDDFVNRPYDLTVIWGESNPHRKLMMQRLIDSFPTNVFLKTVRSYDTNALPRVEYVKRHCEGRAFISADGHGLGDARLIDLTRFAAPFRKESLMVLRDDFVNGHSIVEFPLSGAADEFGCILPDLDIMIDTIKKHLEDKELLYLIYVNAFNHLKECHG